MARTPNKTIHWDAVLSQGTGFFGTKTPQHVDARQCAWTKMQSAVDDAGREGADTEFVRACTLYLAELAAADALRNQQLSHDSNPDQPRRGRSRQANTLKDEAIHETRSLDATNAFEQIKHTRRSLETLLQKWTEAKGTIGSMHHLNGDTNVAEAFIALRKGLDAQIADLRILFTNSQEHNSHLSEDEMLQCLSGLRRYLQNAIGTDRPLLRKLASSLSPPLPMRVTHDHLRSVIHQYRRRHHTTGPPELERLEKEFKTLQHTFSYPA